VADNFDPHDFEHNIPEGHVLCPRCDGHQFVYYGEEPCPFCGGEYGGEYGGEGYVAKEKADRYRAKQAEYHAAFKAAMGEK